MLYMYNFTHNVVNQKRTNILKIIEKAQQIYPCIYISLCIIYARFRFKPGHHQNISLNILLFPVKKLVLKQSLSNLNLDPMEAI